MSDKQNEEQGKKAENKKGFITKLLDKLDKKLEKQATVPGCCGDSNKDKGKPCC